MDDKKLAFETAMTQMAMVAKEGLSEDAYLVFLDRFSKAWERYDDAIDFILEEVREAKKEPKDKRFSLSLTFGFKREG